VISILLFGDGSLGALLVLSQVVLSLQLGFAVVPLIHFCSDRTQMKEFTIRTWTKVLAWATAGVIVVLNGKLVVEEIAGWIALGGDTARWVQWTVVPLAAAFGLLLIYITFAPWFRRTAHEPRLMDEQPPLLVLEEGRRYTNICITVDFSSHDQGTIRTALNIGGREARYILIHVVESAVARYLGALSHDRETDSDSSNLEAYAQQLRGTGHVVETRVGHGSAVNAIAEIVNKANADLLVMGAHGHRGIKDILKGATVDAVRHRVKVPVLIVQ
jgi:manganese transport protein